MTLLDMTNSLWEWGSFDWANKVETIWKTTICQKKSGSYLEQYIKMDGYPRLVLINFLLFFMFSVLSWVVMSRIIITHLYTISHMANFYSIITWSREKMLLPWLTMSAFKNFFLEVIVLFVIILLYLEGNLSGFLFSTAVFEKIITLALSAHNWNAINALYIKLKEKDKKWDRIKKNLTILSTPFNIMIGMNMQRFNVDEDDRKKRKILSLPNLSNSHPNSILSADDNPTSRDSKSLTTISLLNNYQLNSRHNSSITDDLRFPPVDKVLKALDLTHNDMDEISLSKYKLDDKSSNDSASEILNVIENVSGDVDSQSSTCVCLPNTRKNNLTSSEESLNIHLSTAKSTSTANLVESHSEWSRHWNLASMLRSCQSIEMKESETEYDIGPTYDEKCCQWSSSEEELVDEINEKVKEEIYFECWKILNDLLTTVFLEIEVQTNSRKNNKISEIITRSIETQTTNSSFRTNITQTSLNELPSMQYDSFYMQMLMNLSKKDNMHETTQYREKKEMEALKVYNAMTLWKYKEDKDKMALNTMEPSTSDKFKINSSKKKTDHLKTFERIGKTFNDSPVGRVLDRSQASMNIPGLLLMNPSFNRVEMNINNNKMSILKTKEEKYSCTDNNVSAPQVADKHSKHLIDLKAKISSIDWTFPLSNLNHFDELRQVNFESELLPTDFIDEYDTIPLLQSAFSSDARENLRGFYLGPASSDFYSISEQIPDVFHEIIKTSRIKVITYNCLNYPSTQEVDFGEDYFKNWNTIQEKNKTELLNINPKEVTNIHHCEDLPRIPESTDTIINNRNNFLHTETDTKLHYFDDDSDWSDEVLTAEDYFSTYIKRQDSLSDFSNQSDMSEFRTDGLTYRSTSSQ